ncbi:MAG TPA: alkyl sulfatase dimerization domain-containing protein [Acidimicrobiales bacterium]|nr:MBL fold metallo-hydrolase [Acidiferrobacteraceae bacterium]MDP6062898.1 alkyl sulfatase dimerization domain-containing protein [Acidimicrobiales bacterium]MDP7209092.1 alkyl sulfatase dimerization domain-containing protein [Acidimicrobiales bacterium]HJL88801.1 alkyl sulfatase dimerization domain-containing protein [Acidimicrobiales bacterium]HJO99696.1 alkyl sulfatase dimerization domain-containing protein [Acidimicrobiales bacterium]
MSTHPDPVELSSRIIDTGTAEPPHNRVTGELTQVDDDIAVVESFSHCWVIRTDEGLVCFDTSGARSGAGVVESIRNWTDAPFHSLVYTHGHLDHVGGSGAFIADAEARGEPRPKVLAHEAVPARFDRYRTTNGWNIVINLRQFGGVVKPDAMGIGGSGRTFLPDSVAEPDETFRSTLAFSVGDRSIELHHARGETDDHAWGWDALNLTAYTGDFMSWVFPNAGNPQKVQRYPIEWAAALREMLAAGAEQVFPAHGLPIVGRQRVELVLGDLAEALEHLSGRTLELMNEGATLDTIIHEVTVPNHLQDRPWLAPQYDEPEFVVRNVYRQFGGWWDGNAANLKPAPESALAAEVVSLAGSVEALTDRARELAEAGELRLACHLVEMAVAAEPHHEGAHRARAAIYWQRRKATRSLMSKGIFAAAARESEAEVGEKVVADPLGESLGKALG